MIAGVGLGWRPQTALLIARDRSISFSEVVAENVMRHIPEPVDELVRQGRPVIPHGVSLSLGSATGIEMSRLDALARVVERLRAPIVSEHVAFVRAGGIEAGHLLPVERSPQMLEVLIQNVRLAQRVFGVPLALENIASLVEYESSTMSEAEFFSELVLATGAEILLDLSNLHANATNHCFDPVDFLDQIPLERIAYVHLAGGIERGGLYHDTHAHPLPPGPLALLGALLERTALPPPVLLERDQGFGDREALPSELEGIRQVLKDGGASWQPKMSA